VSRFRLSVAARNRGNRRVDYFLMGYVVGNTTNSLYSIGILLLIYPIYLLAKAVSKRQTVENLET
jgi:hypothetical protein